MAIYIYISLYIYTRPNLLLPATEIAMYNAELQESKFASNLPLLSSNLSRILSGNLSRILFKFEQFCTNLPSLLSDRFGLVYIYIYIHAYKYNI